jgi:crotonobetainyl-CoA:carnitine CoA-transferase CaiB-like acyl-CoA transferase
MQPLAGIKVLDLSRILAGPHAAQTLADLGAEVTKIEAPWGDDTRRWGPPFQTGFTGEDVAAYYLSCNRGKTVLNGDIKIERERIRELIAQADVVIENFRPGTFDRLLGPVDPQTVLCSISGYGQSGPRRDEVAFDLTMQARSGIMSITGDADGGPAKVGVAWIDVMTGMNAVSAILAALYHREKTGEGARIDISLWDTALAALVNQGHNALAGITPGRMGSAHPNLVPYRAFQASDGWFAIGVGTENQWKALVKALDLDVPERWTENSARINEREAVEAVVQTAVAGRDRAALEALLNGIPCAPVNTVNEALVDVQTEARGGLVDHEGVTTLASPLRFLQPSNENKEV